MATCANCGMAIRQPEKALYDGDDWYCDYRCHGQAKAAKSAEDGSTPA